MNPMGINAEALAYYGPKIKLYHWWPGREWERGYCPIPMYLVNEAIQKGRRYMTVAIVEYDGGMTFIGKAECSKKDVPCRWRGREIALARLKKNMAKWERVVA